MLRASKLYSRQLKVQLSWLSLHAQPYTDNYHYHDGLDCCSSKLVSHSLLQTFKFDICLTALHRVVNLAMNVNVVFGVLYSAVNYSQQPHRLKSSSTVWTKVLKFCRNMTNKSYVDEYYLFITNDIINTTSQWNVQIRRKYVGIMTRQSQLSTELPLGLRKCKYWPRLFPYVRIAYNGSVRWRYFSTKAFKLIPKKH